MMAQNVVLPCGTGNMGVYLSGRDVLMTEHFLNNPKVSPVLDQMRRKGVPECVWRYVFPYSGFQGIGLNPIPYIYIATLGVNISYMLPTSIRAIPVGYGLEPKFMLKKGVGITVMVIILMSLAGWVMVEHWPAFSTI